MGDLRCNVAKGQVRTDNDVLSKGLTVNLSCSCYNCKHGVHVMSSDETTIADVIAIRETEKAVLCEIYGEEIWIPKSAIMSDSEVKGDGDEGFLVIKSWLAKKEGFDV